MALNCNACEELRENAPDFVVNEMTDTVCTSLKNNTGLNPRNSNTNCDDMHDAVDCLVGRMAQDVEAYEVCDWKEYMRKFVTNIYNVLKGIICWLCGIQETNDRQNCQIDKLANGVTFRMGEEDDTSVSHVVAGEGVSYKLRSYDPATGSNDMSLFYVAGGMGRIGGSLSFFTEDFVDGDGERRSGNPAWGVAGNTVDGSELVYEFRILKSQYPQISRFFTGIGQEANNGGFHVTAVAYSEGQYAYGQHGGCNVETGVPFRPEFSEGHLVPEGWIYLQVRMTYLWTPVNGRADWSPVVIVPTRLNIDASC